MRIEIVKCDVCGKEGAHEMCFTIARENTELCCARICTNLSCIEFVGRSSACDVAHFDRTRGRTSRREHRRKGWETRAPRDQCNGRSVLLPPQWICVSTPSTHLRSRAGKHRCWPHEDQRRARETRRCIVFVVVWLQPTACSRVHVDTLVFKSV